MTVDAEPKEPIAVTSVFFYYDSKRGGWVAETDEHIIGPYDSYDELEGVWNGLQSGELMLPEEPTE